MNLESFFYVGRRWNGSISTIGHVKLLPSFTLGKILILIQFKFHLIEFESIFIDRETALYGNIILKMGVIPETVKEDSS